jgi:membrane protease YdiL (CAAX protease family)
VFDLKDTRTKFWNGLVIFVGCYLLLIQLLPVVIKVIWQVTSLSKPFLAGCQLVIVMGYVISVIYLLRNYFSSSWPILRRWQTWLSIIVTILASFGYMILYQLLRLPYPTNQANGNHMMSQVGHFPVLNVLYLLTVILVVPIAEELVFQYYFQRVFFPTLLRRFNQHYVQLGAIVGVSLLFMLWHVVGGTGHLGTDFSQLFAYGDLLFYALLFAFSKQNILPVCIVHILWNLMGTLLAN